MMETKNREIAYNCKYYLGDRPCTWHKQKGVLCRCEQYAPLQRNLLIIKLDAMGDVLRTTSLLPVMAKAWPGTRITWITRQESIPLLDNNPFITEIIPYGPDALLHLSIRSFDHVINLDAGKVSSGMAAMARAKEKTGYVLDERGYVIGTNAAADEWLRMGVFDDLKKENRRTYQEMMCSIIGLPTDGMKYVLALTETEESAGRKHLRALGLDLNKAIIGIHTGGGGRWPLKQWSENGFAALIPELAQTLGPEMQAVLFGGPLERELNSRLTRRLNHRVFDAGCENDVRHFAALVKHCSVMLSGDSLAMHVALATSRPVVVLFGPTSSAEIELFGLGEKVVPDMSCLVCYRKSCDVTPTCMDSITVDMVKQAILRRLPVAVLPTQHMSVRRGI